LELGLSKDYEAKLCVYQLHHINNGKDEVMHTRKP
jgi:hypothetical protein